MKNDSSAYRQKILQSVVIVFSMSMIAFNLSSEIYAETDPTSTHNSEFTKIEGEDLENNPQATKILQNIEESKKILADLQNGDTIKKSGQIAYEKFMEEQRQIASNELQKSLEQMYANNEANTPRAVYSQFVAGIYDAYKDIFWDQFDYCEQKIMAAHKVVDEMLKNGANRHDAHMTYINLISMPRTEMVQVLTEANIKYGFADPKTQSYFDENGNLPRFDNDVNAPCYNCESAAVKLVLENIDENLQKAEPDQKISTDSNVVVELFEKKLNMLANKLVDEKDATNQRAILNSINELVDVLNKLKTSST